MSRGWEMAKWSRLRLFVGVFVFLARAMAIADGSDPYYDRPEPGEAFTHFFARITRGGQFPGIRLEAPKAVEEAFKVRIFRPTWEGDLDLERSKLKKAGVELWGSWYPAEAPLPIIAPTETSRAELIRAETEAMAEDPACASVCRKMESLFSASWDGMNVHERQALTKAMVTKAKLFGGQTILDFLAREHGGSAADVLHHAEFRLLNSADFAAAVREAGWDGPIYFRGITMPVPGDPTSRRILLNDDLMRKMTPFDRPLIQALEYVGILTHEMSHVFQDQVARSLGIDLQVKSAEGALLIEGEAEYLAESAMVKAAAAQDGPSALGLFVREQGVEIVNRPGQEQQGNLFPYTVGLPFAASLFDLKPEGEARLKLEHEILNTIDERESLTEMLKKNF